MLDKKKVFKIIMVAAVLAAISLLYGAFLIQGATAKIEAGNIVLLGLDAKNKTQVTTTQPAIEPAEITVVLITDSTEKNLVSLSSLVQQLKQLPELKIIAEKNF